LVGSVISGWMFCSLATGICAERTEPADHDILQKKKDLKDVRKELSLTKQKEKKIQGTETSILEQLQMIEFELYKKEKELKQMETRLSANKEKLNQTRTQITRLGKDIGLTREELYSRLTALYKMGRIAPESFLLSSQSYIDLLRIDKYLRTVIDSDARLVDTYRRQVSLKERYQNDLMQDQTQWRQNISDIEGKKEEVKKIRESKRNLLKAIQNQKVVYQKLIGELEGRAKDLQAFINKLEREKGLASYGNSKHEAFKGRLTPPVEGKIISLFGEKGQNGIEIKAPMGTEIRAVLPGKILYADWFKGFGNIVIIDHGDHTFTVSGYCSELLKKPGDIVSQGDVIALVGSNGSLKGACLYFEVRHQGKTQDPMNWISHPDKIVSLPEKKGQGGRDLN
jgi:murein hydrolase activator